MLLYKNKSTAHATPIEIVYNQLHNNFQNLSLQIRLNGKVAKAAIFGRRKASIKWFSERVSTNCHAII
jgi:hypothetical protein